MLDFLEAHPLTGSAVIAIVSLVVGKYAEHFTLKRHLRHIFGTDLRSLNEKVGNYARYAGEARTLPLPRAEVLLWLQTFATDVRAILTKYERVF